MTINWTAEARRIGPMKCLWWSIKDNIGRMLIGVVYVVFSKCIIAMLKSKSVHPDMKKDLCNFVVSHDETPFDETDESRLKRMREDYGE